MTGPKKILPPIDEWGLSMEEQFGSMLSAMRVELQRKVEHMRGDLRQEISEVRGDFHQEISAVLSKLNACHQATTDGDTSSSKLKASTVIGESDGAVVAMDPIGEARVRRLEMPVFYGFGLESWIFRSERYFSVC